MPRRPSFDLLVAEVASRVPERALEPVLDSALGTLNVALCLHRVGVPRPGDPQPALTIPPEVLDGLIATLVRVRPAPGFLTVTFDDGYEDAALYVQGRARSFPTVEFLLFVCPEKTEARAGFRWDVPGWEAKADQRPLDVASENAAPPLVGRADAPGVRLATVELLRELAALPNVELGNHTNCHFKQTALELEQAAQEYRRSSEDFRRLFGPEHHFAFPFGTPGAEFTSAHVGLLRARGGAVLWSTERRPYAPAERRPGAVLPRFPVNGTWSTPSLLAWIAARAVHFRLLGTRHVFAPHRPKLEAVP